MKIVVECAKMAFQIKKHRRKEQCLEGVTVRHAPATDEQEFTTALSRPYRLGKRS
jgi:hypothetical protein